MAQRASILGDGEPLTITVTQRLLLRGTIQSLFHLTGRQTESFLESLFIVMRIELAASDKAHLVTK
ncbi:hypothetical protein Chro_4242 [Chroococcidiopsis thermalis PCC 7203]|uniref:Uncharacterized protein n=1 Tax=Chroococcidiopsis thermalis (strain PCC 7203) TaxID=251229 RepID=K9U4T1_CHRTP|nr:hypothetical protein Chro_4242 [Chroococcidiopsis thermalis PCC 7203]